MIREHAERWQEQRIIQKTNANSQSYDESLRSLKNEQKRYLDAYGKGLIDEELFSSQMSETNKQINTLSTQLANSSKNRGIIDKIDIEELILKATRKIGMLEFEQKKFIIERVIDKIVASPKEITIWGHIPLPSLTPAYEKVNHVSQYRHRWPTKCRQIYPV